MKALFTFFFIALATVADAQQIDSTSKPGTIYIIESCHGLISNLRRLPSIDQPNGLEAGVFTRDILQTLPVSNLTDIVALVPKVYQFRRGDDVSIAGGRTDGTLYIIDGVRIAW